MHIRIGVLLFLVGGLLVAGCSGSTDNGPSGGAPPDRRYGVSSIRLGAQTNAEVAPEGPSLLLQGSGPPLDTAMQAHINQVARQPLDVVVLAASTPSGADQTPECSVILALDNVHSCETITLPDPRGAELASVAQSVREAEVVYFAGGNQCNYVDWRGTALHAAVEAVWERGGGVGGGSAGLAIQGGAVYDGCTGSVRSEEALSNPYHPDISFTTQYFEWPVLHRLITDSHFAERNRMGRLIAFVARQVDARGGAPFTGLGINGDAAVVVGAGQQAKVYGGAAYLVHADHPAETLENGTPLTYTDLPIVRLQPGDTYDLADRPLEDAYVRSVTDGTLSAAPYHP